MAVAQSTPSAYPARLQVDYPAEHNRVTSFFRIILVIPIVIVMGALSAGVTHTVYDETGKAVSSSSGGITAGLFVATAIMIVFRQRYPRWWFDFGLELSRFGARIWAYLALLSDQYPSTVDEQSVHLDVDYPDVKRDLNRWLPIVKVFLAIPHFIIVTLLFIAAFFAVIVAWFAILFTGRYPHGIF